MDDQILRRIFNENIINCDVTVYFNNEKIKVNKNNSEFNSLYLIVREPDRRIFIDIKFISAVEFPANF